MNLNPVSVLNPIFSALDSLIESDGVYLYLVFVWLALLAIVWILSGGLLRQKRPQRNSVMVVPAIIFTLQSPRPPPPPTIGIEVDLTWDGDDETTNQA